MEPAQLAKPAGKDDICRYGRRPTVHNLTVLIS
jgi:hypothetical protein